MAPMTDGRPIGEVARAAGLTVRTLHHYEEIGLLVASHRSDAGHRRYADADLERLYRICLLRQLGLPLIDVARVLDDPEWGLGPALARHAQELASRVADEQRLLGRLARVRASLRVHADATSDELIAILEDMTMLDSHVQTRIATLVCDDIGASFDFLTTVFGLGPGVTSLDDDGVAVHSEIQAGDGVVWLHPVSAEFHLATPRALGAATAMVSVLVDDVDRHHEHAASHGAEIVYSPMDQPYGYREYSARDLDGHLWSFMKALG